MQVIITVENIDPESADESSGMGITNEAWGRVIDSLSWLGDVADVEKAIV